MEVIIIYLLLPCNYIICFHFDVFVTIFFGAGFNAWLYTLQQLIATSKGLGYDEYTNLISFECIF